jgi:hypothetical protein
VNSRKDKVSKGALLFGIGLALALLGPTRPPELPATLLLDDAAVMRDRADAARGCGQARDELRFEMISDATEVYPPTGRGPLVCLAVYRPSATD